MLEKKNEKINSGGVALNNFHPEKDNKLTYLIFFLIGIISFPVSLVLSLIFTPLIENLQNTAGIDLSFIFEFFFPLLVCSILLTAAMYISIERSPNFALKVFSILLTLSMLLFLIFLIFTPLVLVFILAMLILGFTTFKKQPYIRMSLKACSISFFALFLIFIILLMWSGYQHEMEKGVNIQKVTAVDENTPYMEIHEQELEAFPGFKYALNQCREFEECHHYLPPDEWRSVGDFLDEKKHRGRYLFSISTGMENELHSTAYVPDMSPIQSTNIPGNLKIIFESNNISLSEIASIRYNDYKQNWLIFERSFLFGIDNPELIDRFKTIEVTEGGGLLEEGDLVTILELNNAFESNGFSISEQYWILRDAENWRINAYAPDGFGECFEIWEEDGNLNVYTQEKKTYEIWKEDGNLNVYDGNVYTYKIFKVGDDYYTFSLWLA